MNDNRRTSTGRGRTMTSALALLLAIGFGSPAFAAMTVENTPTATADGGVTDQPGTDPANPTPTIVNIEAPTPSLDLQLVSSVLSGADGSADAGETITYTYTVTNDGAVTLTVDLAAATGGELGTDDPVIDAASAVGTAGASTVTLAPGQTATFTLVHTVTSAEIANAATGGDADGNIDMVMDVTGTATVLTGGTYDVAATADPAPVTAETPVDAVPTMEIAKTAYKTDVSGSFDPSDMSGLVPVGTDPMAIGSWVTYVYSVTNTGNVPLTNVTVSDNHVAAGALVTGPVLAGTQTASGSATDTTHWDSLAAGETVYFLATYRILEADALDN